MQRSSGLLKDERGRMAQMCNGVEALLCIKEVEETYKKSTVKNADEEHWCDSPSKATEAQSHIS